MPTSNQDGHSDPPPGASWMCARAGKAAPFLVLAVLTLVVFGQTRSFDFVNYDDDEYVASNRFVQDPFSVASLRWAFTTGHFNNWHPVTWLSHMLDVRLFGLHAGAHHAMSVLLHAINACLLFSLFRSLTKRTGPALVVAALFAAHPLHVESVAWIAERKDLLSAGFSLAAMLAYASYAQHPRVVSYLGVTCCLALALMAKSMAVTLPCVLLLLDYWPLGRFEVEGRFFRRLGPLLAEKIPWFALAAAAAAIAMALRTSPTAPTWARVANAALGYAGYLRKTFWPLDLAVFYPHPGVAVSAVRALVAAILLVVATSAAFALRKRKPYLVVGWLWFLGALAPAIGVVQIGVHAMADRYTYFPLIGLFVALVWGAADMLAALRAPRFAPAALAIAAVLASVAAGHGQTRYWRNSRTLFAHAVAVTPANPVAHTNLGLAYAAQRDFDRAIAEYRTATDLDPNCARAHDNLATALTGQGRIDEAIRHHRDAIRADPYLATPYYNLGITLLKTGRLQEALKAFLDCVQRAPGHVPAHYNAASILLQFGQLDRAGQHLRIVVGLDPGFREAWLNLGAAEARLRRFEEAREAYEKALEIDPDSAKTHADLGAVLFNLREYERALTHFERALDLDAAEIENTYDRSEMFADGKRYGEAVEMYERAYRRDPSDSGMPPTLGAWLEGKGKTRAAIGAYEAAIERRSGDIETRMAFGRLLAARGRVDDAVAQYRRAIEIDPACGDAYFNLGAVAAARHSWAEAAGYFEKAVELDPTDRDAHDRLEQARARVRNDKP